MIFHRRKSDREKNERSFSPMWCTPVKSTGKYDCGYPFLACEFVSINGRVAENWARYKLHV